MGFARFKCETCGKDVVMTCNGCNARAYIRYMRDKEEQALLNNIYSTNPGEVERWADDGGQVP